MSKTPQFIKVLASFPRPNPLLKRRKKKPTELRKIVAAQQFGRSLIEKATQDNYAQVYKSENSFCLACKQAYDSDFILKSHLYNDYDPDYDSVRCPLCNCKSLITPFHVSPKQERLICTLIYIWENRLLSLYQHY